MVKEVISWERNKERLFILKADFEKTWLTWLEFLKPYYGNKWVLYHDGETWLKGALISLILQFFWMVPPSKNSRSTKAFVKTIPYHPSFSSSSLKHFMSRFKKQNPKNCLKVSRWVVIGLNYHTFNSRTML